MAVDFFGVRIDAKIKQFPAQGLPGRTVELWVDTANSQFTDFDSSLAFVSQVDVSMKLGEVSTIQLVLTPPFEEGLQILDSELIRLATGRLEVTMSYTTGDPNSVGLNNNFIPFSGFMQKPDVQVDQNVTITLNALGVGYPMVNADGATTQSFGKDKSVADVVQSILQKYVVEDGDAFQLDISQLYDRISKEANSLDIVNRSYSGPISNNVDFFAVPPIIKGSLASDRHRKNNAEDPGVTLLRGPRNDWWFVKEILADYGYEMILEGNKLFVVDKSGWLADAFSRDPDKRKKFLLRGNVDPSRNMFPILSFSSPTTGAWVNPGLGRMSATDYDDATKGDAREEAADVYTTDAGAVSKDGTVYDPDNKAFGYKQDAARHIPGDPNDPAVRAQLRAEWKKTLMDSGIQCEIQSIGIPTLKPGDVVDVSGFQPFTKLSSDSKFLFNGPYGVMEVRHSVGVGGWTTSFVGIMNLWPKEVLQAAEAIAVKSETTEMKENADEADTVTKQEKQSQGRQRSR